MPLVAAASRKRSGSGAFSNCRANRRSKVRYHFHLKPGIALHPAGASPTRMRQRKISGQVVPKVPDGLGKGLAAMRSEVAALCVHSDEQRQSLRRQSREQTIMPERRAFRSRREICPFRRSGIAEPHGHQRNAIGIVEFRRIKAGPVAKPDAAVVLPGYAARMDASSGGLADDDEAGACAELNDRADSVRQVFGADTAPAYFRTKRCDDRAHANPSASSRPSIRQETPAELPQIWRLTDARARHRAGVKYGPC